MDHNDVDTIVIGDTHLTEVEKTTGLWRKYNQCLYSPDKPLLQFFKTLLREHPNRTFEFVFNGDTFDFDQIHLLPEKEGDSLSWKANWEKMQTTAPISIQKIQRIIQEHDEFIQGLARLVTNGHRLVFLRGNHDVEMTWQEVKDEVADAIIKNANPVNSEQEAQLRNRIQFFDWFYYQRGLFYIEHGNQYDSYSNNTYHLNPYLRDGKRIELCASSVGSRIATRRLGFFNPYLEDQFVLTGWGYVQHYMKYIRPHKKDFFKTWFVGSLLGIRAMMRFPYNQSRKEDQHEILKRIAETHGISVDVLETIQDFYPPAIMRKMRQVFSVLQIDKALIISCSLIILIILGIIDLFIDVEYFSMIFLIITLIDIMFLLRLFLVKKKLVGVDYIKFADTISRQFAVPYVIFSHTHSASIHPIRDDASMYFNEGTWSPAFYDVECMKPLEYRQSFVWIHNGQADMYQWDDGEWQKRTPQEIFETSKTKRFTADTNLVI